MVETYALRGIKKPHVTAQYERWRVRNPKQFMPASFRTQDIGRKGYSKRIAGKLRSGKWATQSLLISHRETPVMKEKLREEAAYITRMAKAYPQDTAYIGALRRRRK
jgi:hypothetical protein